MNNGLVVARRPASLPAASLLVRLIAAISLTMSLALSLAMSLAMSSPVQAITLDQRWADYLEQRAGETTTTRRYPFDNCFAAASASHRIPKTLLLAMARGESNFDAKAVSSADAVGVMQIRWPVTARHLGILNRSKLFDPCISIEAGARYMDELLDRFSRNLHTALVAYNVGPTYIANLLKTTDTLPEKKTWYSQYIHDHLKAVLRAESDSGSIEPDVAYKVARQFRIIRFELPLRARKLVTLLEEKAPGYQFEWRKKDHHFDVNLTYHSEKELRDARRILSNLGLISP